MAVVVRAPSGRLLTFVKGADSAVIPLLRGYGCPVAPSRMDEGAGIGTSTSSGQAHEGQPPALVGQGAGSASAGTRSSGSGSGGSSSHVGKQEAPEKGSNVSSICGVGDSTDSVQHAQASVDVFSQQVGSFDMLTARLGPCDVFP